jgi:RNA polymerase sigma-70 factor (ECF subfamily)
MPPLATWFTGRDTVLGFLAIRVLRGAGNWRMVSTRANRLPAFAAYGLTVNGTYVPHGIQVLTWSTAASRVSRRSWIRAS